MHFMQLMIQICCTGWMCKSQQYGRQIVIDRGVVRSCDPLQNFGGFNHINRMDEPKDIKFSYTGRLYQF